VEDGSREQLAQQVAEAIEDLNPNWAQEARCYVEGLSVFEFFPSAADRTRQMRAQQFCSQCSVRIECLADAIVLRERVGIRGGMGPKSRFKLARSPSIRAVLNKVAKKQKA